MAEREIEVVLASASPRRRELMRKVFRRFRAVEPEVDEEIGAGLDAAQAAEELARRKARAMAAIEPDALVVSADTITKLGEEIIGKPRSEDDARNILRRLSGTRHSVITGVCLVYEAKGLEKLGHEETKIAMRRMSDSEIDDYVRSGEAMGKAGAYAVQETGDRFVAGYEGSFWNIVGLPVELVRKMAREMEEEAGISLGIKGEAGGD